MRSCQPRPSLVVGFQPTIQSKTSVQCFSQNIVPYISRDVKFGIVPNRIRERIAASDCLIIVITETGSSAFVQNEVGIAYALNKPGDECRWYSTIS